MNLKLFIAVESVIFGALIGVMVYLTKFVFLFEVEREAAMIIAHPFYFSFIIGLCFVFLYIRRMPSLVKDRKSAKRMVSVSLIRKRIS